MLRTCDVGRSNLNNRLIIKLYGVVLLWVVLLGLLGRAERRMIRRLDLPYRAWR